MLRRTARPTLLAALALALAACGQPPADPHAGHDHGRVASFTNGNFDSGTLTGWTVATYLNASGVNVPPTTIADLKLAAGGTNKTSAVTGAPGTVIPYGLSTGATLRVPRYGNGAAVVNKAGTGQSVNQLYQRMTATNADVDPADNKVHVRFALAPVLNSGGHAPSEQPYFWVQLRNVTKGIMLYQTFNYTNQPGQPWKTDPANSAVFYTDWQLFDIAPGAAKLAVGDEVEMLVLAGGCQWGGHWGEIYVDAFGASIPGLQVAATAPQQVNTGANMTYTFSYSNGGTAAALDTKVDVTLPSGTTFVTLDAPGATCTSPAVGSGGVVSCNVGTVNPAASGRFTVTVRVTAGAGSTVALGTYQISATGVAALIGPLVNTSVTSGVTYADLAVTKSDGLAAVTWGQHVQYAVVATNLGPGAANGARVTDAMPATLANVTWTCAAAGGAACGAASGAGSIDQAVPTLPSGGSVTFLVDADVVSGSGSGTLVNQATVAAPAGVTDNYLANNDAVDNDAIGTLFPLTLQKAGTGSGTVISSPAAISCGTSCTSQSADFLGGTSVVLTATAAPGYTFNGWSGPCTGAQATCTVAVSAATAVTADFGPIQWPVTGSAPGGNGTVSCTSPVDNGTTSTCTITPAAGYQLTALTDNGASVIAAVSGGAYVTPAVTAPRTVVGTFTLSPVQLATSPGATAFHAPAAPVAVDPGLSLTNGSTLSGAVVSITAGLVPAQDRLAFTTQGGISGSYDAARGVLTLTGTASVAAYQAALRSVTYAPAGSALATGTRQVTFSVGTGLASPGNGHFYEYVSSPGIGWSAAVTAAAARRYFGLQGYLVTVTSQAENDFVRTKLAQNAWMGAQASGAVPSRIWSWVTGPETGTPFFTQETQYPAAGGGTAIAGRYANWADGEPNNWYGLESVGHFYASDGTWNDYPPTDGSIQGYVVEYGGMAGDMVVALSGTKDVEVTGVDTVTFATDGTAGATLTGATTQFVPRGHDATAVTANYPPGWHFTGWTGTGGFTAAAQTVTVTAVAGDVALVAHFAPDVCGNAVVEPSEACDDSNAAGGDGCSATCQVEAGWSCPAAGAACQATCGDGLVVGPEACDDANVRAGDGCTATCQLESGWACLSPGTACLRYPVTIQVRSGAPQQGKVGAAYPLPVCFEVLDAFSAPIAGQAVSFATPAGGPSVSMASPIVTDASGLACAVATANTRVGAFQVQAAAAFPGRATLTAAADLANVPGDPCRHELLDPAAAVQQVVVGHPYAPLAVRIRDCWDNPVPGAWVDYLKPDATGDFLAVLSSATATADEAGVASVGATANNFVGSQTVSLRYGPVTVPAVFSLSSIPDAPAAIAADWRSSPQAALVGGSDFAWPLGATVTDRWGNVVPGVEVLFTAPASGPSATLRDAGGALAFTAVTDAAGHAALTARSRDLAGPYQVHASVGALRATYALENTTDPAGPYQVAAAPGAGAPQHATVATAFATALTVAVQDAFGNPAPGVTVTFAAPASGASAALSSTSVVTDLRGEATVTATANATAGAYLVLASAAGGAAPMAFELTNDPGEPARVVARADTATQAATVGTTFAKRLVATVYDAFDNLVPGAAVAFATPQDGTSAVLTDLLVVSDAAGEASTQAVATTAIGSYDVTASAAGAVGATFRLTNLPGLPGSLGLRTGTGQQAVVDAPFASRLEVEVRDRYGNPVPGVTVQFSAPAAGATAALSAPSASTGADGRCSVSATAGRAAGAYLVTATAQGVAAPVQFGLANLPGAPTALLAAPEASGQSARVGEPFAAPLAVTVLDARGNPVPGASVAFACPAGAVTCTLDAGTVVSDLAGRAWAKATAGATPGALRVTASLGGATAAFDLTALAGQPGAIEIVGGAAQQAPVFAPFASQLTVRVKDRFGNLLAGIPVAFEVVTAGAQGAVLGAAAAPTGGDGVASVTAVANAAQGAYGVRATAPGVATPVVFGLVNQPLASRVTLEVSLPVTSAVITGGGVSRLRAVVDTAEGRIPTGTVTISSSRPLQAVPGQPGVSQSGDAIVAVLDHGSAAVDLVISDWQARTVTATFTPDAAAAPTFTGAEATAPFVAAAKEKVSGGCATGGAGSLGALGFLALALLRVRAPRGRAARAVLLSAALLLPAAASAQVTVGLRAGYATAAGSAARGSQMSEGVFGAVPLQLDLGWRVLPSLTAGVYGAWGPARIGSLCDGGSCSGSLVRAGVQGAWRFGALFGLEPWAGAGVGWERAALEATKGADRLEVTRSGWEYLSLQAGADLPVREKVAAGLYVQLSLGRYGTQTVKSPLGDASGGISDPANHSWLQFGLRGTYDL